VRRLGGCCSMLRGVRASCEPLIQPITMGYMLKQPSCFRTYVPHLQQVVVNLAVASISHYSRYRELVQTLWSSACLSLAGDGLSQDRCQRRQIHSGWPLEIAAQDSNATYQKSQSPCVTSLHSVEGGRRMTFSITHAEWWLPESCTVCIRNNSWLRRHH